MDGDPSFMSCYFVARVTGNTSSGDFFLVAVRLGSWWGELMVGPLGRRCVGSMGCEVLFVG